MEDHDVDNSVSNESDLDVSARSLDIEFGVPIVRTPGVKKEHVSLSSRQKNLVTWFGYDEYMAHHYAFMMMVAFKQEPKSFTETAHDPQWMEAMEEEMHLR